MSEQLEKTEEPGQKTVTIETLKQSLGDLRYAVSQFQDNIEQYLESIEETWREVKSWLASIEARLAGMEVQLSALRPDAEWRVDQLNQMLEDLNVVGSDLAKMRQRFRSFAQGTLERIN